MSLSKYPGEAMPIICFGKANSKEKFEFSEKKFWTLLNDKQVVDRKISIISVVGAFRKGKSFLLDYFLRYLYANVSCDFISDLISFCMNFKLFLFFALVQFGCESCLVKKRKLDW